jgi:hypothetical protein
MQMKYEKEEIDFQAILQLEDDFVNAEEDANIKRKKLVETVYNAYMLAENKTIFFDDLKSHGLQKSKQWYHDQFQLFGLPTSHPYIITVPPESLEQPTGEERVAAIPVRLVGRPIDDPERDARDRFIRTQNILEEYQLLTEQSFDVCDADKNILRNDLIRARDHLNELLEVI